MTLFTRRRPALVLVAIATALGLSACSDGIQLEGKIFEAAGLTGSGVRKESQLEARHPLVLPPDAERLPEPGSGHGPPPQHTAFPIDPEVARAQATAQLEARAKDYCSNRDWYERKDKADFDRVTQGGQLCPSLLTLSGNKVDESTYRNPIPSHSRPR